MRVFGKIAKELNIHFHTQRKLELAPDSWSFAVSLVSFLGSDFSDTWEQESLQSENAAKSH